MLDKALKLHCQHQRGQPLFIHDTYSWGPLPQPRRESPVGQELLLALGGENLLRAL